MISFMNDLQKSDGEKSGVPQLLIRNVTLTRENRAVLKNLSITVSRGKFIAIVGPSGAGKTSLLHCLAGMLPIQEGEITYHCNAHCAHPPVLFRPKMGLVFQNFRLIRNASVMNNVLCGSLGRHSWWQTLLGFSDRDRAQATELITNLELGDYTYQYVSKISGGEQQRVALARALMQEPEVILADEPVSNLDHRLAEQILNLLTAEAHQKGRTVLCVLHDFDLVKRFSDFILFLNKHDPGGWRFEENKK